MHFRWNDWNREKVSSHGLRIDQVEVVVESARSPYPLQREDDKYLVWGADQDGEFLQVVFLIDPDGAIFVIHGRRLTEREKKRYRRREK